MTSARRTRLRRVGVFLASADVARAYALTAFGTLFSAFGISRAASPLTYSTIVFGLCALGVGILVARRREISFLRLVPTTLVLLLGWAIISLAWTTAHTDTLLGWLSTAGVTLIAIVIAHVRDTLQTARALGDALRWVLSLSLALEILSGILLDMPIRFLAIQGDIAVGGPIQGIFGTRNQLGFAAVLALITFVIEWRTASVRTGVALFSVVLAGSLAVLSGSPTVLVVAVVVGLATAVLAIVRHAPASQRAVVQGVLGGVVLVGVVVAYAARSVVIRAIGAGTDFSLRADLWDALQDFIRVRPITGWGWFGPWPTDVFPFTAINYLVSDHHESALNSFLDVLLQLGWFGLVLFAAMAGLALLRSWLVAGERRAVVYAWTPLILIALLVDSLFESFTLIGFGWLMLVLVVARAGLSRSWRERLDAGGDDPEPAPGRLDRE